MTRTHHRPQGGFTLIELMVVIAIVATLAVLAIVNLKGRPGIADTASILASHTREASRKAITGGVVDQAQVTTFGGVPLRARARLRVRYDAGPQRQIMTVELRDESLPDGSEWLEVSRHVINEDVAVHGFNASLALTPGVTTILAADQLKSRAAPAATLDEIIIYFAPDGTSIDSAGLARPMSLFLTTIDDQVRQLRVVVLPLQASALVLAQW